MTQNSELPLRIVLVEPYYGGSHQAWADGYVRHSGHDVTLLTHPARFWKWRMHGAFLTMAEDLEQDIADNGMPDVILASSMMNVAAFAGAVRHAAPGVPIAVYFHESQFTYPLSPADRSDLTYAMKNWASAAVGDLVVFNSDFHRSVFRDEARRFLNAFPEDKHIHRVDEVVDRSIVLPVGVELDILLAGDRSPGEAPLIVWNHRWEHDKGPDELLEIVTLLIERSVDFRMAMCGEVFVSVPSAFAAVTQTLGSRLIHEGWAERSVYERLLLSADVVLSTAQQEFFGIGVVEGFAAGAHPVLPDRLVYPERVAALGLEAERVLYDGAEEAVERIIAAFTHQGNPPASRADARQYDWAHVAPAYDSALSDLATA